MEILTHDNFDRFNFCLNFFINFIKVFDIISDDFGKTVSQFSKIHGWMLEIVNIHFLNSIQCYSVRNVQVRHFGYFRIQGKMLQICISETHFGPYFTIILSLRTKIDTIIIHIIHQIISDDENYFKFLIDSIDFYKNLSINIEFNIMDLIDLEWIGRTMKLFFQLFGFWKSFGTQICHSIRKISLKFGIYKFFLGFSQNPSAF